MLRCLLVPSHTCTYAYLHMHTYTHLLKYNIISPQVDEEMVSEKEKLLQDERKRLKAENERNQENSLAAADIVLQNKLIMEAQQRKEFEVKQLADSLRLEEMHRRVRLYSLYVC